MDRPESERVDTDEALVALVCQRDPTALATLYDRYSRAVYVLAAHVLGVTDAEEIVQEVFLTLWNKAGQYDPARSAFGAWFLAIARHRVLDELRRRGIHQRLLAAEAVEGTLSQAVDTAVDIEAEAWRRRQSQVIRCALQDLPQEQRRVLVLAYFGGLSQSAMAAQLGWPLGTVKKRVKLGLQKLRAALRAQGLDPLQVEPSRIPAAETAAPEVR